MSIIKALKPNLCDFNSAYILVKVVIVIIGPQVTQVAFKNCTSITKYISKNDGTTIDDTEHLDLVMPMYNLIEYKPNYSERTGIL